MASRSRRESRDHKSRPGLIHREARLRAKHQVTVPDDVAKALELQPGDRLVFEADAERGEARVRRVRRSYAGSLTNLFGDGEQNWRYLMTERASWNRGDAGE